MLGNQLVNLEINWYTWKSVGKPENQLVSLEINW